MHLQEAENNLRVMQHKLKEDERALMKDSCEKTEQTLKANENYFCPSPKMLSSLAVKDEDSDSEVPDDEGSDSDLEESRPFKPRPTRNGLMAGRSTGYLHFILLRPGKSLS